MTDTTTIQCQNPECNNDDVQQYEAYNSHTGELDVLTFCDAHATAAGFCPGCGAMVAGNEWDDRHRARLGICAECTQELNEELSGDDAPDYVDFDYLFEEN